MTTVENEEVYSPLGEPLGTMARKSSSAFTVCTGGNMGSNYTDEEIKIGIPFEFYNEAKSGKPHPTASTVGELKEQLARLPDDLKFETFMSTQATLIVYNYGEEDMHLEFGE